MSDTSKINDFVIRFSNVNGTGSASANSMFAKAIFRMGIPVTPKNIFPSNIQGLPTWYEVRISEKGYLGRSDEVDIILAVNPQVLRKDIDLVRPGGYLIYDSSKKLHPEFFREDIHFIGIPMMAICMEHFEVPRMQQLFKNIVYVGVLAALLNIEMEVLREIIAEKFAKKPKLIPPNYKALDVGYEYARRNFSCPLEIKLERRDNVGNKIIIDGNTATALGAIYAGASVVAWYPITPSTSIAKAFEDYAKKLRIDEATGKKKYAIVQAEDELAAIGMVIGATWNGARSFTATSGPGVSLMNEFIGLSYYAEIPVVLINVQRGGPSTGMPTRTQQADILSSAYASHGDTRHILLFPGTPKECFEMTQKAFDLAERFQTTVIVMSDLDLGMNDHMTDALEWDENTLFDRGKVLDAEALEKVETFGRYLDVDKDGVCYRTIPGTHETKGSFFTRGTSRDEYARYTEAGDAYVRNVDRLLVKWETAKQYVPTPEFFKAKEKASLGMLFFGTTYYAALEAMDILEAEGVMIDSMRIKAFPFTKEVLNFIDNHEKIFVVEQNRDAQMRSLLINELELFPSKLSKVLNYDGRPITANLICRLIRSMVDGR